jgi:hypothetical protein
MKEKEKEKTPPHPEPSTPKTPRSVNFRAIDVHG